MSWFFVTRIITNRSCICYIACADVKLSWIWWSISTAVYLRELKAKMPRREFCRAPRLLHLISADAQTHTHFPYPHTHTHISFHTNVLFLAAAVYPSPALQREPSSWGWEGWHCRGSASPPHDLHVAQPLKYCCLWRGGQESKFTQFTLVFFSSPTPMFSLSVPLYLFLCHTQTHTKKESIVDCDLLTGSALSVRTPPSPNPATVLVKPTPFIF